MQVPATMPRSCHYQIPVPRRGDTAELSLCYMNQAKLCPGSASSPFFRCPLLFDVEPMTGTVIKIAALLLLSWLRVPGAPSVGLAQDWESVFS